MAKTPVLGRYQILKELGRGAMGRVFLALDPDIQRKVAIKTIQVFASLPESERDEARERFNREARAAGKLLHPGIVTLFDVGEHKGIPFLAMEYVEGTALDRHCRSGDLLPVEQVLDIIRQAAEALEFAHAAGIVHRDIKPANLMLVGGSTVKIMDFGLAKAPAAQLTSDGTLLGTPGYMSPEQVRGGMVDGRSDLFSLACVLYEMLTGTKPFDGDSISSVVYRVVHEDPTDPTILGDRVEPDLALFLSAALSKDPEQRPASGREFADRLEASATAMAAAGNDLMNGPPPAEPKVDLPPPVHARRRKRKKKAGRKPAGLITAILILAMAAGGWFYRQDLMQFWETWSASWRQAPDVAPEYFEATVRTEPEDLPVLLNGEPLTDGTFRFPAVPPHGTLTSELECRTVEHTLDALDAEGEVTLVFDPVRLDLALPVPVEGAGLKLNGKDIGPVPETIDLDLCRENQVEFLAQGYYPLAVTIPAAATPLGARTLLASVAMERIPTGTVLLPDAKYPLIVRIDGKRREQSGGKVEIEAGEHRLRLTNERYWIDQSASVEVKAGESSRPIRSLPPLAELNVLAYPPNCRVLLRKGRGDDWKYLENTPLAGYNIAAGDYHLRVELVSTGEVRDQELRLKSGANPPVRVSFGGK